jgi:hypothetical protein
MQTLLSYDDAPPISAPLRYFLTAPLFAMLAGSLLLYAGPDLFASRWTPSALAFTHLLTAGFMLQAMLGSLQQLLPVVVGANLARPLQVATWVHAAVTPGALLLAAALLIDTPLLFGLAVVLLGAGVTLFVAAAARALRGMAATNPTLIGLKAGIFGLSVTAASGLALAVAMGWSLDWPLAQLTDLHLGWGFMAWNGIVLAAVALVVVPMFQITPEYPAWFGRRFVAVALGGVLLWTLADLAGWSRSAVLLAGATMAGGAVFCGVTLHLLRRSKRAKHDATHHFWNLSMASGLLAGAVWLAAQVLPLVGAWSRWPLLFGALLLFGGFVSVTIGMLYKIVPFLVWLHLQSRGARRVAAPNMKKVLPQTRIDRQMRSHLVSCALLLLAVVWPVWFVYPAGVALIVSNAWLLRNLLYATAVYRSHLAVIAAADEKASPQK